MSENVKAVFLSYASQDAAAAKKICDALRGAGVEVWFDTDGGLEHGDEWDAKIRRQIKECVLFVAIISANTQAREEGYFRIEWELAAQRALGIASGVAFILPVVVDATREADALVPDRFRSVQWTRLPGGAMPAEVLQRLLKLWSHRTGALKAAGSGPAAESAPSRAISPSAKSRPGWVWLALGMAVLAVAWLIFRPRRSPEEIARIVAEARTLADAASHQAAAPSPPNAAAAVPSARQQVEKARALFDALDSSRDDFRLAEEILAQARAAAADDAEVWAAVAQLNARYNVRGWDMSDARREAARSAAQRAQRLDAQSFEVRFAAQAALLGYTGREGAERERLLRDLHRERPADHRVLRELGSTLERQGRTDEGVALMDEAAVLPGGDPLALYNKSLTYWFVGRTAEAEAAIRAAIAQKPFTGALLISAWYAMVLHGDLDSAQAAIDRVPSADLQEDRGCFFAYFLAYLRRDPDAALARLQTLPRDWINDNWYRGPKGLLVGNALQLAGRPEAAAVARRAALKLVEERLAANPTNGNLLYDRAHLLAALGEQAEAEKLRAVLAQMQGLDVSGDKPVPAWMTHLSLALGRKNEAIRQIAIGLRQKRRAVDFTAALLRLDPTYDALRYEPEFQRLLDEADAIEKEEGDKPAAAPKPDAKSVAVLAFANLSDDKANEYFSDGISEELLNVLAKIPGLKVSARTSAFYFKGKEVPVPEIAQKLGVAYVVEGSVRKSGDKVRIAAQLIKAGDGLSVWSDTFTRDVKDVFAVQDEISALIAKNLELKIVANERPRRQVNPEAHRLVLEARHFWNLRTMDGFARAEAADRQAIALDPDFAPAHAGLATVLATRWVYRSYEGGLDAADLASARSEAERAVALDAQLVEAYPALALVTDLQGGTEDSERLFAKGIALNPNFALNHHWLALVYENSGRLDDALREIEKAIDLDPLAGIAIGTRGRMLAAAGRYDDAIAAYTRAAPLVPDRPTLHGGPAIALYKLKRFDEAAERARHALRMDVGELRLAVDGEALWVLRQTGHEAETAELSGPALARLGADSYQRGAVLAALGRWDEAEPFLERTPIEMHYMFFWNPVWDTWRDDPRFARLIAKLNCAKEYRVARETLARIRAGAAR